MTATHDVTTAELQGRELLEAVLDHAPGFIMAIDEHGKLQFINRVLPQHDMKDVIGSDWLQYMPPDLRDALRDTFCAVLETGRGQTYETSALGPNGEQLSFASHMGPMRSGGHVVGVVIVAQDVTELRRTQVEFAAAQRMVAVGTLAAGIAHEINTPVQFVGDSLDLLQDGMRDILELVDKQQVVCRLARDAAPTAALTEAIAEAAQAEARADLSYLRESLPDAFERCSDGLGRVARIVRSIGEFAHPSRQEMAPTDLNRAISSTLTIARSEYLHLAELETDLRELPPVTCHVDQINQVVLNLVVNAAHAIGDAVASSGDKGRLSVATRMDGDDVIISVSDTGTGIPDAARAHVFEPFFTTKEVGKGTGQGLAHAWAVVTEKHGGTLTFETRVGKGTTFFVRLPAAGARSP